MSRAATRTLAATLTRALALLLALALAPAPLLAAGRGGLGGGEEVAVSLWRIVAALLICVAVALLAVLLIRQRAGKIDLRALLARIEVRSPAIQVVETRRLSLHADICLLRHDDREYLLLLMAGDSRVLRESKVAPPPGQPPAAIPAAAARAGLDR
jgi:hypothetical protein